MPPDDLDRLADVILITLGLFLIALIYLRITSDG